MVQPQRRIYRNDVSAELGWAGQGRYKRRDPALAPGLFCGEGGNAPICCIMLYLFYKHR